MVLQTIKTALCHLLILKAPSQNSKSGNTSITYIREKENVLSYKVLLGNMELRTIPAVFISLHPSSSPFWLLLKLSQGVLLH